MPFTTVASAIASTQLLGVDTARRKMVISNSDANRLYVLLDPGTASATNYSFFLDFGDVYESEGSCYKGTVNGIWAADGSGSALLSTWSN